MSAELLSLLSQGRDNWSLLWVQSIDGEPLEERPRCRCRPPKTPHPPPTEDRQLITRGGHSNLCADVNVLGRARAYATEAYVAAGSGEFIAAKDAVRRLKAFEECEAPLDKGACWKLLIEAIEALPNKNLKTSKAGANE